MQSQDIYVRLTDPTGKRRKDEQDEKEERCHDRFPRDLSHGEVRA